MARAPHPHAPTHGRTLDTRNMSKGFCWSKYRSLVLKVLYEYEYIGKIADQRTNNNNQSHSLNVTIDNRFIQIEPIK